MNTSKKPNTKQMPSLADLASQVKPTAPAGAIISAAIVKAAEAAATTYAEQAEALDARIEEARKAVTAHYKASRTSWKEYAKGNARSKSEDGTLTMRQEVAAFFKNIAGIAGWPERTAGQYQSNFLAAVQNDKPFTRSMHNKGSKGAQNAKNPSKAIVANDENALRLFDQAIELWRQLKDPIVADLLKVRDAYYTEESEEA